MVRKIVLYVVIIGIVLFGLIQLLPIGRVGANPAVVQEPAWDSPATRELAVLACYDCHSSETRWPWYSKVAPASWLLAMDVVEAREEFSFSDWKPGDVSGERAARAVTGRSMPPSRYLLLHPDARLTDAQIEQLAQGLRNTLK